ncbi:MAG: SUMF1/EgtB/PvdO family nonheme iron enzyme [Anaerolineae bacterium]|nr:SUMF1/EgtB/PvdO family nonheme iron enzyme [Anaerolineae bacterium]
MTVPQLRLFVNYRRADDREFAETLRLQFMNRYGRENVFMDFDSLPNFTNFEEFIKRKVRECDALVMMIGAKWTDLLREKAAKGDPDYVLIELEEALKHHKLIAPIRLRDASMPDPADIPDWLHPISKLNAPDISPGRHLIDDVTHIITDLEAELVRRGSTREVANPESQTQIQSSPFQPLTIQEMQSKIRTAEVAKNWPEALIWIDQLRQSGHPIPPYYAVELDRREQTFRQRLHEEEDRRRRREVADYEFIFIRDMLEWGASKNTIIAAVHGIWEIDQGYIPDDLAPHLRPLLSPVIQVITPSARYIPILKPGHIRTDAKGVPQVYVPAGRFLMGSDPDRDQSAQADEQPQHEAHITQGFWLDQFPVTNAHFQVFIDDGGYRANDWWSPKGLQWKHTNNITTPQDFKNFIEDPKQPRVGLNWYEAEAYANWRGGRLPTEAEWEYAARGVKSFIYPWGDNYDPKRLNAETRIGRTTPVDAYPNGASWCGAFDLSGNIWEWCADWYSADFYIQCVNNKLIDNPVYARASNGRVLRGGSWRYASNDCRAAHRHADLIGRSNGRGCRVIVATVPFV